MTSAAPCPPVAAPVVPQTTLINPPAVAGPGDVDDEAVGVSGLYNAKVAEEMNKFLVGLQAERHYVGISAFLIFALRYRLRVRVWYGTRCEDLLSVYAPWASDAISHNALFQAICCKYGGDRSLGLVEDDPRDTNHYVACFPIGSGSSPSGDYGESLGEGETERTATFYATYMSLSLNLVQIVCDGDCGLDVMCLMLGWTRAKQNRNLLKSEMAAFALKHIGNRAFIAMLSHVGELNALLGFFQLDSAGAELIEGDAQDSAQASHHGNGGAAIVVARTPEATQRNFSDEEMLAVT